MTIEIINYTNILPEAASKNPFSVIVDDTLYVEMESWEVGQLCGGN